MKLYPVKHCQYCQEVMREAASWSTLLSKKEEMLCDTCRGELVPLEEKNSCTVCGHPDEAPLCRDCEARDETVLKQRSLYPYTPFLQEVIAALKYRGDAALADLFTKDLRRLARKTFGRMDIVTAIPLHETRLYERGFNQAALLAGAFPVQQLLVRTTKSEKQSKTAPQARTENTSGVFELKEGADPAGKSILLVDDIYTSGATLHAAAAPLFAAGARSVQAVTLARAIQKK